MAASLLAALSLSIVATPSARAQTGILPRLAPFGGLEASSADGAGATFGIELGFSVGRGDASDNGAQAWCGAVGYRSGSSDEGLAGRAIGVSLGAIWFIGPSTALIPDLSVAVGLDGDPAFGPGASVTLAYWGVGLRAWGWVQLVPDREAGAAIGISVDVVTLLLSQLAR